MPAIALSCPAAVSYVPAARTWWAAIFETEQEDTAATTATEDDESSDHNLLLQDNEAFVYSHLLDMYIPLGSKTKPHTPSQP